MGFNSRKLLFTAQQTQKSSNGVLSSLLLHHHRSSHLTTTCVSASRARTTWSASQCCASTARPPSSPRPPSSSGPSIPLLACAAAARWASRAITVRRRSTCAIPTPAWMVACAPAKKEGTPASAAKTTRVSEMDCVSVSYGPESIWCKADVLKVQVDSGAVFLTLFLSNNFANFECYCFSQ